jgi:Bacterial Ig domain
MPQQRPGTLARLARLAGVLSLWVAASTVAVAATAQPSSGQPSSGPAAGTCAAQPGQDDCTITSLSIDTSSLAGCSTSCVLDVGTTAELPVEAVYSDGSEGPLSVVAGQNGPQASFSAAPVPSAAFTLSGVVNGAGDIAEVQLTAEEPSTAPAVVEVTYDGLDALSPSITAAAGSATCGVGGLPQCFTVNGALLTVQAVTTSTAGDMPVAGAVVDVVQAGPASGTGAVVGDQPCYPDGAGTTCGPPPAGDPATAPSTTCTTQSTGSCALTAMWDGSNERFSAPDTLIVYPPPGYAVTAAAGCAPVAGTGPGFACTLAVPDGSNPLTVGFGLEALAQLTVALAGPLEPDCDPVSCSGATYDNDAVDGATVTASPTCGTPGQPATCEVEGGSPGGASGAGAGQSATCTLALVAGTYSVSMPSTISTPDSEVDIAFAYVTGPNPQGVTLTPGEDGDVDFASAYEPTITVNLAGPAEPSALSSELEGYSAGGTVYDNDAVDGTTVTMTPTGGTAGAIVFCQVEGGYPGDNVDYGEPASCNVSVAPGTYSVSVPSPIETPDSEVGIPEAYVTGANPQTVTVAVGSDQNVNFSTVYEPSITVNLDGPLEPACTSSASSTCTDEQTVYDNDAVDGTTATITPTGGSTGTTQTCQLEDGYPGDNVDYGQPASCSVGEPAGTYSISLPPTIQTPYSEVDIPVALVTSQNPQSVTLGSGDNASVTFKSAYEPSINITLAGPLEPSCSSGSCPGASSANSGASSSAGSGASSSAGSDAGTTGGPGAGPLYDDDAVNGTTVTVKPTGGTSGPAMTCQVEGGEPDGTTGSRQEASCNVGVSPGTYEVSVPARIVPSPDYGWGGIEVKGSDPEKVTVTSSSTNDVTFTTAYETADKIGSGSESARTKDGLLTASASGGTGTVSVSEYSSDPEGSPTFNRFSTTNDFFDVSVSAGNTFQKLEFTICGLAGNPDQVYWWEATASAKKGSWQPVSPASAVSSLKPGCLTANLSSTTSPALADLGGTAFGVALHLAGQRVSFASRDPGTAVVGSAYKPSGSATSKLAVAFSVASTSTKGACSLAGTGTLEFTGAGTCVLVAAQSGNTHWAAASATRDIVVMGKPLAEAASYSIALGRVLRVPANKGVLAKDEVNDATITAHTTPDHGTLTLLGDGAFTYVARPGFSGKDRFTYTLRNRLGRSTATVTIDVGNQERGRQVPAKRR